jgi:hypothetical protein
MIAVAINNIRSILESQVQGEIKVSVSHYDTLYIQIIHRGSTWNFTIDNISSQLHYGLTTEEICNICMRKYKSYIFTLFLKN